MEGKRCLMKKKTRTARRTLEPLYQQQLEFKVEFTGKTLQVNELSFCSLTLIISPTRSLQFNSENGYMPCRSLGVRLNSFLRSFAPSFKNTCTQPLSMKLYNEITIMKTARWKKANFIKVVQTTNKRNTREEEPHFDNFLWDKRDRYFVLNRPATLKFGP